MTGESFKPIANQSFFVGHLKNCLENTCCSCMTWPGADVDVATNTVGKPLAHVEMRIADEQGKFILNQVFA